LIFLDCYRLQRCKGKNEKTKEKCTFVIAVGTVCPTAKKQVLLLTRYYDIFLQSKIIDTNAIEEIAVPLWFGTTIPMIDAGTSLPTVQTSANPFA
jgi:hypothetical protein